MSRIQSPAQSNLPTEPKPRPAKRKSRSTPPAGRLEDARQPELFPDLPRREEPVPDDWDPRKPGGAPQ
jgi:hypothetical protein